MARHVETMNRIGEIRGKVRRLGRKIGIEQGSGFTSPSEEKGEDGESGSFQDDYEDEEEEDSGGGE
eukprot:1238609-Pyramimonas_sp.AAC.1